jgi:glycerophosphoryl diester phosphodiesterase
VSELPALRRVGHKGADHIAPGNTAASFDAALDAGVDMIEFDVLPEDMHRPVESRLLLAHDYSHGLATALTLDEGLAHLASSPFTDVELDVDLKLPGYEARVVDALRTHGLVDRTLVSTTFMRSLVAVRALEPRLRLGWSVPRARRDYTASWTTKLYAYAAIGRVKRRLPEAAHRHLTAGRCEAVMAHWRLVTDRLVGAVREAGGELYVWTVDDAERIRRLERQGVTGVITNDPRLFVMHR